MKFITPTRAYACEIFWPCHISRWRHSCQKRKKKCPACLPISDPYTYHPINKTDTQSFLQLNSLTEKAFFYNLLHSQYIEIEQRTYLYCVSWCKRKDESIILYILCTVEPFTTIFQHDGHRKRSKETRS